MGKKVSRKQSGEEASVKQSSRKSSAVEEVKAVEEDRYTSDLVKLKVENQKTMEKAISKMQSSVKQSVDSKQVLSAVKALQKHFKQQKEKKSKSLLEDTDAYVHLGFTMTRVPTNPTPRPMQVAVPKPFNTEENDTRVCIIVKDPESDFRDQIQSLNIPCIAEVIGFDRLRREFRQYKDKRQLFKDFDLFLADIRIYKMLPELLGKEFYSKKAFPCPVKLHGYSKPAELESQLNRAAGCAYYSLGNGPNYGCRVAKINQDAKDIVKNFESALGQILGYTCCWDSIDFNSVCQISVKVGDSIELPVYNFFTPAELNAYMEHR